MGNQAFSDDGGNGGDDGQGEKEGCARAELAFRADDAAVGEHDVLGDGQAKASAAGLAGTGFIDPVEALEDAVEMFRAMPGPKSCTKNSTAVVELRAPTRTRWPLLPYFMAFSIRLPKTWLSASGSASTNSSVASAGLEADRSR